MQGLVFLLLGVLGVYLVGVLVLRSFFLSVV